MPRGPRLALSVVLLKISLFNTMAERDQVGVGFNLFGKLVVGQLCGEYSEKMTKHQSI